MDCAQLQRPQGLAELGNLSKAYEIISNPEQEVGSESKK